MGDGLAKNAGLQRLRARENLAFDLKRLQCDQVFSGTLCQEHKGQLIKAIKEQARLLAHSTTGACHTTQEVLVQPGHEGRPETQGDRPLQVGHSLHRKHTALEAAHQTQLSPYQQSALPAPDPGGVQLAQRQAQGPDHRPPPLRECLPSWSWTSLTMPAGQIVQPELTECRTTSSQAYRKCA